MNSLTKNLNDSPRFFEFAEFSFDASKKLLWRGTETIPLAPKACDILAVLIENAPQVLSKEELMNQVWNDSFVEEANLTHHISALRKALGEDKNGRKFIETIPRKGYRFVAKIIELQNSAAEITISERIKTHHVEQVEIETIEAGGNNQKILTNDDVLALPEKSSKAKRRRLIPAILTGGALLILLAVFGVWRFFERGAGNRITPQNITFKRLTPDADALGAAISPDSKYAAYSLLENGSEAIWRKNLTTGETLQLTPTHPTTESSCSYVRYSPDGEWVYFICNSLLYRIPATGGVTQKIKEVMRSDYAFSPDGKQIAFLPNNKQLIIAPADGNGDERVLAERDGVKQFFPRLSGVHPGWSPDGKRIMVPGSIIEQGKENYQLVEIDVQTGGERIIPSPPNLYFLQIHWLADGSGLIVNTSENYGMTAQIKHVSYPDGKITPLTNDNFDYPLLQLTRDSRTIIAHRNMVQLNLWTAPAEDLSRRKQITTGSAAIHGWYGLTFAPDGKIIYASLQNGGIDLWKINADGSGQIKLTNDSGKLNQEPNITADGRYIVFQSYRGGTNHVWRIDADGRNPMQLSRGDEAWRSQISPDGKWVYYGSRKDGNDNCVFKVSIDGGEPVLLDTRYYVETPIFSPDGKWLLHAWQEKEGAPFIKFLKNTVTGEDVKLPESVWGKWSPDSKSILFIKAEKELWKFDIADRQMQKIADFKPDLIGNFAVSPDGRTYVFSLGNFTSEPVLIENFWSGETK